MSIERDDVVMNPSSHRGDLCTALAAAGRALGRVNVMQHVIRQEKPARSDLALVLGMVDLSRARLANSLNSEMSWDLVGHQGVVESGVFRAAGFHELVLNVTIAIGAQAKQVLGDELFKVACERASLRESIMPIASDADGDRATPNAQKLEELRICEQYLERLLKHDPPEDAHEALGELRRICDGHDIGWIGVQLQCEYAIARRHRDELQQRGFPAPSLAPTEPVRDDEITATELTRELGVPPSTLQRWNLKPRRKTARGMRVFSREEALGRTSEWRTRTGRG